MVLIFKLKIKFCLIICDIGLCFFFFWKLMKCFLIKKIKKVNVDNCVCIKIFIFYCGRDLLLLFY